MDNSSPRADGRSHQQQGIITSVKRVFIISQRDDSDWTQFVADTAVSGHDMTTKGMASNPRRLRMTDYSYPSLPPSHYHWGAPGFPRPVVIPKQLPPGEERAYVHIYDPSNQTVQQQQELNRQPSVLHEEGATKVLCLTHMLSSPHLLDDDVCYNNVMEDVDEEACVFSNLVKVVIPRPSCSNVDPVVAGVGKVFLEYACLNSSNLCKNAMDGRWWDGKQIVARFYPEDKFASGDYSCDGQ